MTVRANVHVHSVYTLRVRLVVSRCYFVASSRAIFWSNMNTRTTILFLRCRRETHPCEGLSSLSLQTHLTREAFGNFYEVSSLSCALIGGSDNEQCNIYCAFFTTRLHFFRSRIKHALLSIRERGSPHTCIELVLSDLTSLES